MTNKTPSGFDIDLGNHCSKTAYSWAKKTFANRTGKAGEIQQKVDGSFANMLRFGDNYIGISSDGIGTKIEVAERCQIYNTIGFDLMAMVVDDLVAGGFIPTNLSNILDVDLLNHDIVNQLMQGLHDASNFASVAITGGEIAELGNRIGGFGSNMHFNWCATAIGALHSNLQNTIDGSQIEAGDAIMALQSHGFRSNGFSAVRRILKQAFGQNWHEQNCDCNDKNWGDTILEPSLIYTPIIARFFDENVAIKGIAHVTGGGLADNLKRILKVNSLGATMNNLFEPHAMMKSLMNLGDLSYEQAFTYWNMGHGMLVIVPQNAVEKIETIISKQETYKIRNIGVITADKAVKIKAFAMKNTTVTDMVDLEF
ncbi:MAG: AIR synthase-related protein [Chitinophagales bacterium]